MASVARDEGIGLDIVSGGELAVALAAGFPAERCHFHGNNKGEDELREAHRGRRRARSSSTTSTSWSCWTGWRRRWAVRQPIILRLSPGVDPHTHAKTTTGTLDNKFGLPISHRRGRAGGGRRAAAGAASS